MAEGPASQGAGQEEDGLDQADRATQRLVCGGQGRGWASESRGAQPRPQPLRHLETDLHRTAGASLALRQPVCPTEPKRCDRAVRL